MERFVRLLLVAGLIVSTISALAFSILIVLSEVIGVTWYWGAVFGAYAGPLAFALTMYFNELRLRPAKQSGDIG